MADEILSLGVVVNVTVAVQFKLNYIIHALIKSGAETMKLFIISNHNPLVENLHEWSAIVLLTNSIYDS